MTTLIRRDQLATLDFSDVADINSSLPPVSAGEVLLEEFLQPLNITKYRLAKDIGVPAQRIGDITAGKRGITADTDLRLCRYFGLSDGYWLRLQADHDTIVTKSRIADVLAHIPQCAGVRKSAFA
jgi:antitoxin HigA-1